MPRMIGWLAGLTVFFMVQTAFAVDGWVLAMSWHPGFCAAHGDAPDCAGSRSPGLTLHGLWPEAGPGHDAFCGVSPQAHALDRPGGWCRLPPTALSQRTVAELDRVMPGRRACLDRHEWLRHGTCSGLSADDYFNRATMLAVVVENLAVARTITGRAGSAVTLEELAGAVKRDFGSGSPAAFSFVCGDRNGAPYLLEMRISLTTDGVKSFPAGAALRVPAYPAAHGCPSGRPITIDGSR